MLDGVLVLGPAGPSTDTPAVPAPSEAAQTTNTFSYLELEADDRSHENPFELIDEAESKPYFIGTVVAACCAVFLWQCWGVAGWHFASWKQNPTFGPNATTLVMSGAQITGCITQRQQWWRLFSSWWIHSGLLHVALNMAALLNVGRPLEMQIGSAKTAALYLLSGLASSVSTAIFMPTSVADGASGAILGLIGTEWAELMVNWRYHKNVEDHWLCFKGLLRPTLLLIAISLLLPFVNLFAHLSGLASGFLLGIGLVVRQRRSLTTGKRQGLSKRQRAAGAAGAVVFALLLGGQLVLLLSVIDADQECGFCRAAQCLGRAELFGFDCVADTLLCQPRYFAGSQQVFEVTCLLGAGNRTKPVWPLVQFSQADTAPVTSLCNRMCLFCGQ